MKWLLRSLKQGTGIASVTIRLPPHALRFKLSLVAGAGAFHGTANLNEVSTSLGVLQHEAGIELPRTRHIADSLDGIHLFPLSLSD